MVSELCEGGLERQWVVWVSAEFVVDHNQHNPHTTEPCWHRYFDHLIGANFVVSSAYGVGIWSA